MGLIFESQTKYFESKLQLRLKECFIEDLTAQSKDVDFAALSKQVYDQLKEESPLLDGTKKQFSPEKQEPLLKKVDHHHRGEEDHKEIEIKAAKFDEEQTHYQDQKPNPNNETIRYIEQYMNGMNKKATPQRKQQTQEASSTLMLNFILDDDDDNEANCIDLRVESVSPEYHRLTHSPHLDSRITMELASFVFVANPDVFSHLQDIFQYGSLYSNVRYQNFESFMKDQAFWPEVSMEKDPDAQLKTVKTSQQQEERTQPTSVVEVHIPDISLIMMHENKPLYFLNLSEVKAVSTNYVNSSNLRVYSRDLMLKNISRAIGLYPDIAVKKTGKSSEYALLIEVRSLDEDEARFRGYSAETSVKLNEMKLLFLNRVVNELVKYLLQYLIPSLVGESEEAKSKEESAKSPPPRSDSKFSLLILNSLIQMPRNSASDDYLMVKCKKIGLWSVGKWGDHCGRLIEHDFFDFEKEEDGRDEEDFKDAFDNQAELEQYLKDSQKPQGKWFHRNQREQPEKKKITIPEDDQMRISIEGLQIFIKPPEDDPELTSEESQKEKLFASISKKGSIKINIIFEDKTPLILQQHQTEYPMKSESIPL